VRKCEVLNYSTQMLKAES